MKHLSNHVDLLAGLAALGWAALAMRHPDMAHLVVPEAAGAFALVALGRWVAHVKGEKSDG
jgi:hypothetical protein